MSNGLVGRGVRGAFALGLATGAALACAAFAWLERDASSETVATGAATDGPASMPRWHGELASADLESAVRVSARLLALPAGPATSTREVAALPVDASAATRLARAEDHRRRREFREACALYAEAAAAGAMTADAWADYADAQASLTGRIAGEPARAIAAALALDPQHPKALWLQASLAHEEGRYADALAAWQRLQAVVPAGSSDARIVEANIAEAARLAAG